MNNIANYMFIIILALVKNWSNYLIQDYSFYFKLAEVGIYFFSWSIYLFTYLWW